MRCYTSGMSEIATLVDTLAEGAARAARAMRAATASQKNRVLEAAAQGLERHAKQVTSANEQDLKRAREANISGALLDRLELNEARLDGVVQGVREIAALPDPVGHIDELRPLPNGLQIGRMRIPLGVVAMIYESRPNVTADAAALCIKSGNACILRGGSEAFETNQAIAKVFAEALEKEGLPQEAVSLIPVTDRKTIIHLIRQSGKVDLVIPRGGEALIRFVTENASVPVVQHYKGVCHAYVDADADFEMARAIVLNGKVQRPGVCNALETLLVDEACLEQFLPKMVSELKDAGVAVRGDAQVRKVCSDVEAAKQEDWDEEYLDLMISVASVSGLDGALHHVDAHGSGHTEVIVTSNYAKSQRWLREVDASLVLVNASSRFNDGSQLGLGAEIGISTTKLHAYGPMGLEELCARKWVGLGNGEIRQ